jgi:hypothetical protein
MWRPRSYPEPGGASRGNGAHGGSGAPLSQEAGAGATRHAVMHVRLVFCRYLKFVHEGIQSSGYRQKRKIDPHTLSILKYLSSLIFTSTLISHLIKKNKIMKNQI